MDARPSDHDRPALSRNLPCGACGHDHAAPLPCDWCPCGITPTD